LDAVTLLAHKASIGIYGDPPSSHTLNDDEDETLGLLTTTGAPAAIAHVKKIAELTGAGRVRRSNEYAEFG
jgi:hypothetical protein